MENEREATTTNFTINDNYLMAIQSLLYDFIILIMELFGLYSMIYTSLALLHQLGLIWLSPCTRTVECSADTLRYTLEETYILFLFLHWTILPIFLSKAHLGGEAPSSMAYSLVDGASSHLFSLVFRCISMVENHH